MTDVVDCHVHVGEAGDGVPGERLVTAMELAGISHAVLIPPLSAGFDASSVLSWVRRSPGRFSAMIRMDVRAANAAETLRGAVADRFVAGIRLTLHEDPQGWFGDRSYAAFWSQAADGAFPVAVYAPRQAALIARIARAHPALPLLLDHAAVPYQMPADAFAEWDDVLDAAEAPNVYFKITNVLAAADADGGRVLASRLRQLYERVGAGRMMWGSNLPHSTDLDRYAGARAWLRGACEGLPDDDLDAIFGGTARALLSMHT